MTTPLIMTNGSTSNPLNIKLAFISTNTPANGFEQSWGSPHVAGQGDVKTEQEKPNLSRFPSKSVHFQQEENVIFVFFFK